MFLVSNHSIMFPWRNKNNINTFWMKIKSPVDGYFYLFLSPNNSAQILFRFSALETILVEYDVPLMCWGSNHIIV